MPKKEELFWAKGFTHGFYIGPIKGTILFCFGVVDEGRIYEQEMKPFIKDETLRPATPEERKRYFAAIKKSRQS